MLLAKRLLAIFLDFLLGLVAAVSVATRLQKLTGLTDKDLWFVFGCVAFIGLYALFGNLIFDGASLGKRLVHIKVVAVTGEPATPWQLLLRQVTLLLYPIELLVILLENKRFGDLLAKTMMVEEL